MRGADVDVRSLFLLEDGTINFGQRDGSALHICFHRNRLVPANVIGLFQISPPQAPVVSANAARLFLRLALTWLEVTAYIYDTMCLTGDTAVSG